MTATNSTQPSPDTAHARPFGVTGAIFLISVLGLFLELMLIRWIGTDIRIFAYLQNTILIVCFLGLGFGCFTSRQPISIRQILVPLLILLLLFVIPPTRRLLEQISSYLSVYDDLLIWFKGSSKGHLGNLYSICKGLSFTFIPMVLILIMFIPVGRILGRLMNEHPHIIKAYSVNICGSLAGTWLFVLLGVLYQPPVTWFLVLAVLLFFFIDRRQKDWWLNAVILVCIVMLSWLAGRQPDSIEAVWSPYQKLVLYDGKMWNYTLKVNNVGYQALIDLSQKNVSSKPKKFPPELSGLSQYDLPALFHPNPQSMLIVGAGTGNDAAGALRNGVQKVTAVEIDPAILSFGRRYHPEKPYDSSRVTTVVDDARSFFATTKDQYDVISFGLLDSHTTTAMTNARLDHYVYTIESFRKAKSLLAPGGVMVLSFAAQRDFIADRTGKALREVFGEEPICFKIWVSSYGPGGAIFVTGDLASVKRQIDQNERLKELVNSRLQKLTYTTAPATDDWPYIYLQKKQIPVLYYFLSGLMLLLLVVCFRFFNAENYRLRWNRTHWHFFFLGAAFLLLEVQNISKSAVALGNTWLVNAVIISGVLIMILLSNIIAAKLPRISLRTGYVLLFCACVSLFFIDIARFASLPYIAKAPIVGILTTIPMLFSGIVFIKSFADTQEKDIALGANLIGALCGAMLQSITFVIGFNALLLVITALYFFSFLTSPAIVKRQSV
jgi:spermidine synthase